MDTLPYAVPAYSNTTLIIMGLLVSTLVLAAIIGFLYLLNTRIRRNMKASRDDWRVEQDIESGHTLHAEGIFGGRHPEEGGLHLKQEDPHPATAALKPGLKHNPHRDGPSPGDEERVDTQNQRTFN